MIALLFAMFALAWFGSDRLAPNETVVRGATESRTSDGDSFAIGSRKLRLKGIDAPEYKQTCTDETGAQWPCGKAARAALEKLLAEPSLSCEVGAQDRYSRSLATCKTAHTPDIAATQVRDGMATSHEFAGMRDYGEEEDAAIEAKRGIWRGKFMPPELWREMNPR
jgi:endonuclease YncB( thermonuclease family)